MRGSKNRTQLGFTLTELLAINTLVVGLAAAVLPAFTQANGGARQAVCAADKHQLGLAWLMYAADNRGVLVQNNGGGAGYNAPPAVTSWANGWEDFTPNTKDNTNALNLIGTGSPLTGTQFGPYVKDIKIYKCPCDVYLCVEGTAKLPRLRSVSMNSFVGTGNGQGTVTGWQAYANLSNLVKPPPALLWVITDEHPDSINDAWFTVDPAAVGSWGDLPGSYHSAGNVMVFADGHADYHKWMDGYDPSNGSGTVQPVTGYTHEGFADPKRLDTRWWYARTSVLGP